MNIRKIDDQRWEIPKAGAMHVPGLIFTSEKMLDHVIREKAAEQVANVAQLPGITGYSMAMPDVHWGYGFPIGGVAAFDVRTGVISPGGVGYDINCGVRLLRTNLIADGVRGSAGDIIAALFANIPSGVGSTGKLNLTAGEVGHVLEQGAAWAVARGYGTADDLAFTEEQGRMRGADAACVSARALERGREQLGTLGAGNHFLELQVVEEIYDEAAAAAFGLFKGQAVILIHTGFGYQVCDDSLARMQEAARKYQITLPDRQLACAPVDSPEGREYFSAMAGAANYAWANRQVITHWVHETLMKVLNRSPKELGLEVVYDVAHNIAKREEHGGRQLLVHRKGATRAFAAGHEALPERYKKIGQPVLVPGTMGTESYVLVGTKRAMDETWGSSCHGAGRMMSRTQALKSVRGQDLARDLEAQGIAVRSDSFKTLAEEAPFAYKDVAGVVGVCADAGLARRVARMKPLGVIKG